MPTDRPAGSKCRVGCRPPSASQAHCSVCHRTFSGVGFFDAHRRDGQCVNPTDLGLIERARLWSTPAGHEWRGELAARFEAVRRRSQA